MKRSCVLIVLLSAVCIGKISSQTPERPTATSALPQFEAAVVREVQPVSPSVTFGNPPAFRSIPVLRGGPGTSSPGQITCNGCSLTALIEPAYGVRLFQIRLPKDFGGPQYDLVAKVPRGSSRAQVNLMLRQLLVDRFGLVVHMAKGDMDGYALIVSAKRAVLLKHGEAESGPLDLDDSLSLRPLRISGGITVISSTHQSLDELANAVSLVVHRPVVNVTGLDGVYSFSLAWMSDERAPMPGKKQFPPGVSEVSSNLKTGLENQLGLKLEDRKLSIELLVIDQALKTPKED